MGGVENLPKICENDSDTHLSANLISALSNLNVHDFPHDVVMLWMEEEWAGQMPDGRVGADDCGDQTVVQAAAESPMGEVDE